MGTVEITPPARETLDATATAAAGLPGADDWQVDALHDDEVQLYLIGNQVESRRSVTKERAIVTLYNDHSAPGQQLPQVQAIPTEDDAHLTTMRGFTTLTLLSSDLDGDRLISRLSDGVIAAGLTDNSPFPLPQAPVGGFPQVTTVDPLLAADPEAVLEDTRSRLSQAVSNWGNVRLSSAELFLTRSSHLLRNSRGIEAGSQGTQLFLDFVLIAEDSGQEAEFHAEVARRRVSDLMIESTVDSYATYARHLLSATPPSTHRGPVILTGDALLEFFAPVIFHASGQAAFMRISRFKPGELVTEGEPRGDRLTLLSDALRPFGTKSAAFDGEGLPGKRWALIQDGVFSQYWAGMRYATYLSIPPSGEFANLTIAPGRWEIDELRTVNVGPVYEIVAFSWMTPDPFTGDFTVEIKLGYRHDETGTHPIKGGSLSGNVFTALSDAQLSAQTYTDGNYLGPAAIRFADLTISGN